MKGGFRTSTSRSIEQFSGFATLYGTKRWIPQVRRHTPYLACERSKRMKNRIGLLLVLIR